MSQTDSFLKIKKIQDRQNRISDIEAEVQCMESCLAQGFTLQDYIETQKQLIDTLIGLNNKL